jgi:hypothetical protein
MYCKKQTMAYQQREAFYGARSQDTNPWQTQVMALGVSRSSGIFLWIWSYIFGIQRLAV